MLGTFALMRGAGGTPFRLEFGGVPRSLQVQLTNYYGLDQPWFVEFWNYVKHVFTFRFGPSLVDRTTSVDDVVRGLLPVSALLALLAAAWAVPLGIGLGLVAALRRNSRLDVMVTAIATVGVSSPAAGRTGI